MYLMGVDHILNEIESLTMQLIILMYFIEGVGGVFNPKLTTFTHA